MRGFCRDRIEAPQDMVFVYHRKMYDRRKLFEIGGGMKLRRYSRRVISYFQYKRPRTQRISFLNNNNEQVATNYLGHGGVVEESAFGLH